MTDVWAEAFLLDNGREYHIAHSIALFEHLTIAYFFPALKTWHYITPIGE
jgi:protein-S-isoprenylcysteine O-methyltransferase